MPLRFQKFDLGEGVEVSLDADGKAIRPPKEVKKREKLGLEDSPRRVRRKAYEDPETGEIIKPRKFLDERGIVTIKDADLRIWQNNDELVLTEGKVGIDTETTGLRYRHGDMPWMVSMADYSRNSWCSHWPVDPFTRICHYSETPEFLYLKRICEDPYVIKTFFNRKFDVRNLAVMGIAVRGDVLDLHDVSFQARVFNTGEFNYKLKPLAQKHRNLSVDDEKELKEGVTKLRRRARKFGWKIFDAKDEENTNSQSKADISAPDYWLVQYAHILFPDDHAFAQEIKEKAEEYCRKDTLRTVLLDDFYIKKFAETEAFARSYQLELMLSPLVESMEDRGILTFPEVARRERNHCKASAEVLLAEIREETKNPAFNPDSSADYSGFLFSPKPIGLGLPPTEQTAGGQYKTGYKEIAHLAWHPFIQKVTKYRAMGKAVSLFFDKYLSEMIQQPDGTWIVHAEINQSNTKTFRFSMSNPNLQQAANPETSARGANVIQVRNAFGPRKGYDWWLFDYSGQEFRILGGLMKVPAIIEAIRNGRDVPTELGNRTWGGKGNAAAIEQAVSDLELNQRAPSTQEVADFWKKIDWYPGKTSKRDQMHLIAQQCLEEVDYKIVTLEKKLGKKVVRTRCKMCLYGKAYGAGPKGLVGLLLCQEAEAKQWLKELDRQFPEMNQAAISWTSFAKHGGYITNAYGRRLTVDPDFAYRATNYRIQGTAAEMMKISMLRCWEYIKSTGLDAHIILTVHDELVFEINSKHCYPWFLRGLRMIMEDHERYVHLPMSVGISRVRESWDREEEFHLA